MHEITPFRKLVHGSVGSLRGKLVLIFVGLSLAVALITALFGWFATRDTAEKMATQIATHVTHRITAYVDEFTHEAELIAGSTKSAFDAGNLPLDSERAWEKYLWHVSGVSDQVRYGYIGTESGLFLGVDREIDPNLAVVKVRSPEGTVRASYKAREIGDRSQRIEKDTLQYDPRTRPWYIKAKETGKPVFTEPYLSSSKKKLVATYAMPLHDAQGKLLGVIGFDFSMEKMAAYVRALPPSENGTVVLKSEAGVTLAETEFGSAADRGGDESVVKKLRSLAMPKKSDVWLEKGTLFAVSPLAGAMQGSVSLAIPTGDLWTTARQSWNLMLSLCLGLVSLAILVGMYSLRSVMRDLTSLRRAAKKLELGSSTIALPVGRNDEIGALARTFEALRQRVRNELNRSNRELKAKSTAYSAVEADLERSDEERRRLAALVDAAHECIALVNEEGKFSYVNETFAREMHSAPSAMVGLDAINFLLDRRHGTTQRLYDAVRERRIARETIQVMRADGSSCHFEVTLTPLPIRDGRMEWALIGRNVTEAVERTRELSREAHFDPVSKLMRRAPMLEVLHRRVQATQPTPFSLLFIDLDGFKGVNDGFGHDAGDQVLSIVGDHLREQLGNENLAGRFGGDEFMVTINDAAHETSAQVVGERIVNMLTHFGRTHFAGTSLSASIGIVSFPRDAQSVATLVRRADQAMYVAKQAGGARVQTWSALDRNQRDNVVVAFAERRARAAL